MEHESHAAPEMKNRIKNLMREMPAEDMGKMKGGGMMSMEEHRESMKPMMEKMQSLMDAIENTDDIGKLRKMVSKMDMPAMMKSMMDGYEEETEDKMMDEEE